MSSKVHPEFHQPNLNRIYNDVLVKQNDPQTAYLEASMELIGAQHRRIMRKKSWWYDKTAPADVTPEQELAYQLEMADLAVVTGKSAMLRQENLEDASETMLAVGQIIDREYPVAPDPEEADIRSQRWEQAYDASVSGHLKTARELHNFLWIVTQVYPGSELQRVQHGLQHILLRGEAFTASGPDVDFSKHVSDQLIFQVEHQPVEEAGAWLALLRTREWNRSAGDIVSVTASFAARALAAGKWESALQALGAVGKEIASARLEEIPTLAQVAGRSLVKSKVRQERIEHWKAQYATAPASVVRHFEDLNRLASVWQHFAVAEHVSVPLTGHEEE